MSLFALATLLPAALLCLGGLIGGAWIWAGLAAITVGCFALDHLTRGDAARRKPDAEFPVGDGLSVLLAALHLPMLALSVIAVAAGDQHSLPERIGILTGFGLFFGQIGHPNAHELIHRHGRWLRGLGVMVYATLLFGHHASAHRLVHHVHVGTDQDPNSAPLGLGFWRFAPKAIWGSFRAGLVAERTLRSRGSTGNLSNIRKLNPYFIYILYALAALSLSLTLGSAATLIAFILIVSHAQIQILLADYVQHYGLRRKLDEAGRPEPVGPQHSWNSPHLASSAMMLNAPRHSDHHLHPARHYPALQLEPAMPLLPYSLPVMAVIALIPPLWRRVMNPRVAEVAGG